MLWQMHDMLGPFSGRDFAANSVENINFEGSILRVKKKKVSYARNFICEMIIACTRVL